MALTQVDQGMLGTNAQYTGFKNRIINGAMVIDQRNAGAEVNPAVQATYYLDRWIVSSSVASKFKIGQNAGSVTPPTGFINYLGLTSLSAYTVGTSETFGVRQRIEGLNVADLAWGTASAATVTLSFWVYSSLTGTFGGSLRNSDSSRSYPFSYTISSANTWEQKSITIAGDTTGTWLTTNGIGIQPFFSIGAGATVSGTAGVWAAASYASATGATSVVGTNGATFYITGVQLEKGSTATSFDYRPYGTEFNLCQRYYSALPDTGAQNGLGAGVCLNTSNFYFVAVYPVPMRTAPSFTSTGTFQVIVTTGYTASSVTLNAAGTTSAALVAAISGPAAASGGFIRGGGSACSLNFSAEL
jgi:hypothetical protein